MRIRKRRPCLIELDDRLTPDFDALLRGIARLDAEPTAALLCPVHGRRIALDHEDLAWLARLSAQDWHELDALADDDAARARLTSLVDRGALLCDAASGPGAELRAAEERLAASGWHPLAASFQAATRWSGVMGDEAIREHTDAAHRARLQAVIDRHGPPPPHFHRREDARERVPLPPEPLQGALADVLKARRTTRHFDQDAWLEPAQLGRVLRGSFGAMGTLELAPDVVAVKKTSPSGGALHPIEAYPLLVRVRGLAPGFYHYEADTHRLALLEAMDETRARQLANALTIGQSYFAEAHALVFLAARGHRNFWKYRRHPKALKAILIDAGHLSQTLYLLATEAGLGAFFTGAVNDADIATQLRLDPLVEFAIGACGIGIADPRRDTLHLVPEPFAPADALRAAATQG